MCGLAGFLGGDWSNGIEDVRARLIAMNDRIVHRGPDSDGYWLDGQGGIALGHRRLAVLDASPAGAQPMVSACGRFVIAFNGEIYNHLSLRRELDKLAQSFKWRGHSDTETLLAGFSAWGIQETIERCIGMFAFAVWNRKTQVLTLGRDRIGEKPLYYGWQGQGEQAVFLFGSELKALTAHPTMKANIDRNSLCLLFRHNYIPGPYSIYKDIRKLLPGCLLEVTKSQREPVVVRYWALDAAACGGRKNAFTGDEKDAVNELEALLKSAVQQQMIADVPLGAFLSGGIDSSTIVALMQAQSVYPVKTFTIGFDEAGFDEAQHAKAVAAHLGTEHTELYVTSRQAMDVIPRLPSLYCEPFSDSSQIPTFLVSQLARQRVTVSLSGDAGDELFAGYSRYAMADRWWSILSRIPKGLRHQAARGLIAVSPARWNKILGPLQQSGSSSTPTKNLGDKFHKGAALLELDSIDEFYHRLVSHWSEPGDLVNGGSELPTVLTGSAPGLPGLANIERMMAIDTLTYLPDDILVKVDRAAMGVSLESRIPFLDHRIVEFAWRLPISMKLRDGVGKWALRQVLYKYVPREMIERPKMGFAVPIDSWLRGPLREWAEGLLDESRLRREGFLNPVPIRQKWREHGSGQRNWQHHLWDILMFQSWLEANKG